MRISYSKELAAFTLVLLGAIAYSNSFSNSFHYFDDIDSIVKNPFIRNIADLRAIWDYWPTRFVTYLSLAVNYRLDGLNVFGYHLFNLAAHILSAVSLWWLVLLTFETPSMKKDSIASRTGVIAFFTAAIFLLHPVQTQPVNYIIQRATILAAFFYITSVAFYAKARLESTKRPVSRAWTTYYALSLLCAAMSFFSKEISVSLPAVIILYEFFFFEGKDKFRWKYVLAFPGALIISISAVAAAGSRNFIEMCSAGPARAGISVGHYFLTELTVITTYLRLLFLPLNLNFDYDFRVSTSFFSVPVVSSALFIFVILVGGIIIFKRYRLISFCLFWFFITLLPESSVIPLRDVIFEHRLYLPLAGFGLFLAAGLFYFFKGRRAKIAVAILSVLIVVYAAATYERNKAWKDELTLWNDTVGESPNKARPYLNRGNAYGKKGDHDRALADFDKAVQLNPDYAEAYYNRAVAYFYKGDYEKARENVRKAEALGYKADPDFLNDLRN